jgi:hypothetical protein
MSPVISMVPDIEPIQLFSSTSGKAGITSAIGLPRRRTRNGLFVLFTSSNNDKHFALNSEIAISRVGFFVLLAISTPVAIGDYSYYHGHSEWTRLNS